MRSFALLLATITVFMVLVFVNDASAHDYQCGSIVNPGTRASCKLSYIRKAVHDRYRARSGTTNIGPKWYKVIQTGYSPGADGPHSFAGPFRVYFWRPTWTGARTKVYCRGSVRIYAHTGKPIRFVDSRGRLLTSKTVC